MFYVFLMMFLFSGNLFAQTVKINKGTFSQPQIVAVSDIEREINKIDDNLVTLQNRIDELHAIKNGLISQLKAASAVGVSDADVVPGVK